MTTTTNSTDSVPVLFRMGPIILQQSNAEGRLLQRLPKGIYSVGCGPDIGFFLEPDLTITGRVGKIYGNTQTLAKRVLNTYLERGISTGAAFHGYKGTGKSMLVREICHDALDIDMPVILINRQFAGEDFNKFISNIIQPAVVVFEEFDKVYTEKDAINNLLTLLDGLFNSNKLYLFSTNSTLPEYLENRPSRVYYSIPFGSRLSDEVIREYCNDHLDTKSAIDSIIRVANVSHTFNFDMLQAIVEESNRYPSEDVSELIKFINVDADITNVMFNISILDSNNKDVTFYYDSYGSVRLFDGNVVRTLDRESGPEYVKVGDADIRAEIVELCAQRAKARLASDHGELPYSEWETIRDNISKQINLIIPESISITPDDFECVADGSFVARTPEGFTLRAVRSYINKYNLKF